MYLTRSISRHWSHWIASGRAHGFAPLLPLLFFLGLTLPYPVEELKPIRVHLAEEAPNDWILGLACREDFKDIPGNAQAICPPHDGPTVVIFTANIPSPTEGPGRYFAFLRMLIAHEVHHIIHGANGPADDPFHEWGPDGAYAAGCRASWVRECSEWLR